MKRGKMKALDLFLDRNRKLLYKTLEELTVIAAPSRHEQKRAEYCLNWLNGQGISHGHIDECGNVVLPFPRKGDGKSRLFMAHLDTVFPGNTELRIVKKGSVWSCPGIGDDTSNAVILLMLVKYLWEEEPGGLEGVLFSWNVGEEGTGNLYGCRKLMEKYGPGIESVVSFDLYRENLFRASIGSLRYRIIVRTEGGHSYFDFGNRNAIAVLSKIITRLYEYEPPVAESARLTYNVGSIDGGTSVNTIAQQCGMLWEYRANRKETLEKADDELRRILDSYKEEAEITCDIIGERPCMGDVSQTDIDQMSQIASECIREVTGVIPASGEASTDCNIPLAMGIPALCVGLIRGGGAHTLEEWIDIGSLSEGVVLAVKLFRNLSIGATAGS